jgi:small subunit ribosomal protein S7
MEQLLILNLLIGNIIKNGMRAKAESIVIELLYKLRVNLKKDPLLILQKTVENLKPLVVLKERMIGGTIYKIPSLMKKDLEYHLAVYWLVSFARKRSEKDFVNKLFNEIVDTYNKDSSSIKKKEELHKTVLASRPFLKFLRKKKKTKTKPGSVVKNRE